MLVANQELLSAFVQRALTADLTYHRTRKELWDMYVASLNGGDVPIPWQAHYAIKSACTCTNVELTDNKRLAFETAIAQLIPPQRARGWLR